MISKQCRKLKYIRNIILVTNGRGSMDADDLDDIVKKIREDEINLIVLYVKSVVVCIECGKWEMVTNYQQRC